MTEYTSNQEKVNKPDHMIYTTLSDFNNFTPLLAGKVEGWCVEGETCSFKIKGLSVKLEIASKEQNKLIKLKGIDIPFEFSFWLQIKSVTLDDSRIRIVVHAKLNTMMKMMLGKKLQQGINDMAQQIASSFNSI